MKNDKIILIYNPSKNIFYQINKPSLPLNRNFVITYRGMDWSGFITFSEGVERLNTLTLTKKPAQLFDFELVER